MKKRMIVCVLMFASLLFAELPAVADSEAPVDMGGMEKAYADYQAQQERFDRIAEIEADKDAAVHELAAKWEPAALAKGNDDGWYEKALIFLGEKDAEELLRMSEATTWEEFIGTQLTSELVFYPLSPCRILDTRNASRWGYSPIPAGGTINADVWGSLSGQGGASNCGVISDSAGAVLNVTAVPVSGTGNLVVYPYNTPKPTASLVNYKTGVQNIANAVVQSMCRDCANEITIASNFGTAHAVVDVIGYFARPSATPVKTVVRTASQTVASGVATWVESPSCPSGYRVTGGGCHWNHIHSNLIINGSRPWSSESWMCQIANTAGFTSGINVHAVCSQVPGR